MDYSEEFILWWEKLPAKIAEDSKLCAFLAWTETDKRSLDNMFLSVDEVSRFTGYSKAYIYKLTHNHAIPFYKPKGRLSFAREDMIKFMQGGRRKSQEEISEEAIDILNKMRFSSKKGERN